MSVRSILLGLTLSAAVTHVTSFIMIMAALDRRGIKTNILMARYRFFKHLKTYKEATEKETGKPGFLHGLCIQAIALALLFAAAAILIPWG